MSIQVERDLSPKSERCTGNCMKDLLEIRVKIMLNESVPRQGLPTRCPFHPHLGNRFSIFSC